VLVTLLVVAPGCSHFSDRRTYERSIDLAAAAQQDGDLQGAKIYWWRAYESAARAELGPPYTSIPLYNYGRTAGYLCQYDEARDALQRALALDEKAVPLDEVNVSMRLFELARLDFAHENWAAAVGWYDRAIPLMRKIGGDLSDPISVADELDRYAIALQRAGDTGRAVTTSGEAAHLRAIHPGARPTFVAKPYPTKCEFT